ncbi:hypothetical protein D3C81_1673030 [compost metagenome]
MVKLLSAVRSSTISQTKETVWLIPLTVRTLLVRSTVAGQYCDGVTFVAVSPAGTV